MVEIDAEMHSWLAILLDSPTVVSEKMREEVIELVDLFF